MLHRHHANTHQCQVHTWQHGLRCATRADELEAIAVDRTHAAALHGGYLDVLDTLLSLLTRTGARMIGISNVTNRRPRKKKDRTSSRIISRNPSQRSLISCRAATTLHDTVFSTIPGAPAYVSKSPKYKASRPELGINVDLQGHNAVQGRFLFEG